MLVLEENEKVFLSKNKGAIFFSTKKKGVNTIKIRRQRIFWTNKGEKTTRYILAVPYIFNSYLDNGIGKKENYVDPKRLRVTHGP